VDECLIKNSELQINKTTEFDRNKILHTKYSRPLQHEIGLNHQTAGRRVGNGKKPAIWMVIHNHHIKKQKQLFGAERILYFLI
jgi:hypothetical protein